MERGTNRTINVNSFYPKYELKSIVRKLKYQKLDEPFRFDIPNLDLDLNLEQEQQADQPANDENDKQTNAAGKSCCCIRTEFKL